MFQTGSLAKKTENRCNILTSLHFIVYSLPASLYTTAHFLFFTMRRIVEMHQIGSLTKNKTAGVYSHLCLAFHELPFLSSPSLAPPTPSLQPAREKKHHPIFYQFLAAESSFRPLRVPGVLGGKLFTLLVRFPRESHPSFSLSVFPPSFLYSSATSLLPPLLSPSLRPSFLLMLRLNGFKAAKSST